MIRLTKQRTPGFVNLVKAFNPDPLVRHWIDGVCNGSGIINSSAAGGYLTWWARRRAVWPAACRVIGVVNARVGIGPDERAGNAVDVAAAPVILNDPADGERIRNQR